MRSSFGGVTIMLDFFLFRNQSILYSLPQEFSLSPYSTSTFRRGRCSLPRGEIGRVFFLLPWSEVIIFFFIPLCDSLLHLFTYFSFLPSEFPLSVPVSLSLSHPINSFLVYSFSFRLRTVAPFVFAVLYNTFSVPSPTEGSPYDRLCFSRFVSCLRIA